MRSSTKAFSRPTQHSNTYRRTSYQVYEAHSSRESSSSVFLLIPIYYIRSFYASFSLPRRNSGPPSQIAGSSPPPLPATVRVFVFIARRIQNFLASLTRVELCLPSSNIAHTHHWNLYVPPFRSQHVKSTPSPRRTLYDTSRVIGTRLIGTTHPIVDGPSSARARLPHSLVWTQQDPPPFPSRSASKEPAIIAIQ